MYSFAAVAGFIKMEFATATNLNGSYGFGNITDGKWELCIHIAQFVPKINNLCTEGAHVEFKGLIEDDPSKYLR